MRWSLHETAYTFHVEMLAGNRGESIVFVIFRITDRAGPPIQPAALRDQRQKLRGKFGVFEQAMKIRAHNMSRDGAVVRSVFFCQESNRRFQVTRAPHM